MGWSNVVFHTGIAIMQGLLQKDAILKSQTSIDVTVRAEQNSVFLT